MNKLVNYIKDTQGELKHVSWPTQKQTIVFTVLIIVISFIVAALLGIFDFIFTTGLDRFVI